jgi:hypothetical protein
MSTSSCAVITRPLCATTLRGSSLGTSTAAAGAAAIDDAIRIARTCSRSPALDPCSTPQEESAHCKQESTGRTQYYNSARLKLPGRRSRRSRFRMGQGMRCATPPALDGCHAHCFPRVPEQGPQSRRFSAATALRQARRQQQAVSLPLAGA